MIMNCPKGCKIPFPRDAMFCPYCGTKLEERVEPLQYTLYLHNDPEGSEEDGRELGLSGEALRTFSRVGYEVGLVLEVDPRTGKAHVIGIEDDDAGNTIVVSLARAVDV